MKKYITSFLMMAMLAIAIPFAAATPASAQTTRRYFNNGRTTVVRTYKKPSFYHRHRNLVNIGIGSAAGALIGGLIGGRRGVGLGLLGGAGAGALYTYKLNPKTRYYR